MKHLIVGTALTCLTVLPARADVVGTWNSQPDDNGIFVTVEISNCGNEICGTIIDTNSEEKASVGTQIITEMTASGDGKYTGGKIYAPDTEKTYNGKLTLNGSVLKVSGCVFGGVICRSQNWTRN